MNRRILALLMLAWIWPVPGDAQSTPPVPVPTPTPAAHYTPPDIMPTPAPRATLPPPPFVPDDVPLRPLTADEAAAIALHHQPNVGVQAQQILAASGRTEQIASAGRTQITEQGTYTAISTLLNPPSNPALVPADVGITGYSNTVLAHQLVFDFEHTRNLVQQARSLESAAIANLSQTQSDLILTTKQDFYTYSQDEALVAVNQANVKDQQEHLREAQARYKAGLGLPLDIVQAEAAVAQAILNLKTAEVNADTARATLCQVMGIDPRTPLKAGTSSEPDPPTQDVTALVDLAVSRRPEVIGGLLTIDANQHALSAAHTTSAPVINVTTSVASVPETGNLYLHELTMGLSINWPFVDGGLAKGTVRESKANLDSSIYQFQIAREGVMVSVTTSYLQLLNAQQSLDTAHVAVQSAQEQLRLAQGRYKAGIGLALDVLDAEAALLTASTTEVQASYAVEQSKAALNHAIFLPWPGVAPAPPVPIPTPRGDQRHESAAAWELAYRDLSAPSAQAIATAGPADPLADPALGFSVTLPEERSS